MNHTIASLQDKSPEELNVICTELLGFVPHYKYGGSGARLTWWVKNGEKYDSKDLPPYATSYDAIICEIKALTDKQSFIFVEHLRVIRNIEATGDFAFTWLMMTSSPADLTRALIITLQSK